jgi:hypothetical protein
MDNKNRDKTVTLVCKVCTSEFHPNRNHKYRKILPKYCSAKCRNTDAKSFLGNAKVGNQKYWAEVGLSESDRQAIQEAHKQAKANKEPIMKTIKALAEKYHKSQTTIQMVIYEQGNYKQLT